ncbi:MAG TPA: methylaspartate mutase [Candidatus Cloacimonetes bacterium]|nr:methylaspartate mutase [Candidatus Cloacimonadota bacterium]HEX37661.1 methylaspartate mutase [Candidatus Cloacimonadota bacterium]
MAKELRSILATDCGSTTTKAILIKKIGDEYRLIVRGEAPTTVEAPFDDVTKGVLNAVEEVEDLVHIRGEKDRMIITNETIEVPQDGEKGVDAYVSTSSAGGGLQMMVAGVVKSMTGESAERAALGAGAIVMDVLASNDKRLPHQRIERIRHLRPDMILLSGGIDGGTTKHVVELAEIIAAADPKPRLGSEYKLPVIYAGNKDARDAVKETLGDKVDLIITDNIRPVLERENLGPARDKIHDLFMEHVMAQAPGYKKLMSWARTEDENGKMEEVPIMPTPGAVGNIMQTIAKIEKIEVVGVDIGGATTDVFSVFTEEQVFNRTVSANLGMSYSISNVLASTGIKNILRWVPFDIPETQLRNMIKNKMIRPTTIPFLAEELMLEQAIAKEALRLAFEQHKEFAVTLKGTQREREISEAFSQSTSGETIVNMMTLDILVGSGGVLSHAPRRNQSAMMMIDAFLPEGITRLAVDSIFMMPQLGVLATISEKAATEVFEKDCLIHLGTCIAPKGKCKPGKNALDVKIELPDGEIFEETIPFGEMRKINLGIGETAKATLKPLGGTDIGAGKNSEIETTLSGGVTGIIIDTRGRELYFDQKLNKETMKAYIPEDHTERVKALIKWMKALEVYPEEWLS